MKRLVLEITNHSGDGTITHRSIEAFPATLGRGYHNDIIVGDPHVSAQHVRIEFDGDNFSIHDLGSENGLTVNDKHHKSSHAQLKSGDVVRVGHTDIRIFDPAHPVPPARRIARQNPVLVWLSRPIVVWPAMVVAALAAVGWKYLDTSAYDVGETLVGTGISVCVTILVWSALWGVAGRLARHKSRFRSHVALASIFVVAVVCVAFVQDYVSFLTNDSAPAALLTFIINAALGLGLLYGALTLATDMSARRRKVWSFFFALGMAISAVGMAEVNEGKFDAAPSYASELQPYFSQLAAADSLETFLADDDKLFNSDTFNRPPEKN